MYAVSSYCKPCYAHSTAHIVWTNTVLVCMCCIVQGMCLKPLLAATVIHCWSSGFLTTFSCQVPSFSPLVLLADHHWNMPYRSWQLSPSGPDSTLLTVNGAHLQVKVEIKVGTATSSSLPTHSPSHPHTTKGGDMCVCVCACVLMQSRCSV